MKPSCALVALLLATAAAAQPAGWQACAALQDDRARLACFDTWSRGQQVPPPAAVAPAPPPANPVAGLQRTVRQGCHDPRFSALTRQWELRTAADCGTFSLRSHRPLIISAAVGDSVNRQPTSENPANNAATAIDYRTREIRLQASVRSKLMKNVFVPPATQASDSLWFAYSQQSYWQLFTPAISRPFRSTDHEPELIYVHPLEARAGDWRLRHAGLGLVHHSNGQSLPYSRSWNRVYLMAGAETEDIQLQARLWKRINEDAGKDDNPRISDYFGRAELQASWRPASGHAFVATARHSLGRTARGSVRLEWFRTLAEGDDPAGGLQLYLQFFTGYGDTLLDYNRRRSVFGVGLSMAEW